MSPREGGAMNRGEPPSAVTPSKGLLWRARTPVGGTFHFEISVMPPLTKTCPKMVLPKKGVAFLTEGVFEKKFSGAARPSAWGPHNTRLSSARLLLRPAIGLYRWLNPAVR